MENSKIHHVSQTFCKLCVIWSILAKSNVKFNRCVCIYIIPKCSPNQSNNNNRLHGTARFCKNVKKNTFTLRPRHQFGEFWKSIIFLWRKICWSSLSNFQFVYWFCLYRKERVSDWWEWKEVFSLKIVFIIKCSVIYKWNLKDKRHK